MRTQVGIVGAGPSGLMLSHLLHLVGVSSIVIENRSRAYCEARVRAGLMEHDACQQMRDAGVGARMDREGLVHHGVVLRFGGASHRIPLTELSGGRHVTVGSDAHKTEAFGYGLAEAYRRVAHAGFESLAFRRGGARVQVPIEIAGR